MFLYRLIGFPYFHRLFGLLIILIGFNFLSWICYSLWPVCHCRYQGRLPHRGPSSPWLCWFWLAFDYLLSLCSFGYPLRFSDWISSLYSTGSSWFFVHLAFIVSSGYRFTHFPLPYLPSSFVFVIIDWLILGYAYSLFPFMHWSLLLMRFGPSGSLPLWLLILYLGLRSYSISWISVRFPSPFVFLWFVPQIRPNPSWCYIPIRPYGFIFLIRSLHSFIDHSYSHWFIIPLRLFSLFLLPFLIFNFNA